jgi:uncharacterized membrane protein
VEKRVVDCKAPTPAARSIVAQSCDGQIAAATAGSPTMSSQTAPAPSLRRRALLGLMALLYTVAGVAHFANPGPFVQMVPDYLPWPLGLVYLSGIAESSLGLLLLWPRTRRLAAWGVIALLVAVFPANLHMAIHNIWPTGMPAWLPPPSPLGLWLRLPLQLVLIAWAYVFTRPARR